MFYMLMKSLYEYIAVFCLKKVQKITRDTLSLNKHSKSTQE